MFQHRLFGKIEWELLIGGLSLLLFSLCIAAWAVDQTRMQRDLNVMEGVLRSLCETADSRPPVWDSGPEARGLYIEGYGALFLVEGCLSGARTQEAVVMSVRPGGARQTIRTVGKKGGPADETDSALAQTRQLTAESLGNYAVRPGQEAVVMSVRPGGARQTIRTVGKKGGPDGPADETDSTLAQTRDLVAEFLGDYGSAIGQLRDDERITMFIRPDRNHHSFLHTVGFGVPLSPLPPLPPIDVDVHLDQLAGQFDRIAERLKDSGVISDSLARRIRSEIAAKEKGIQQEEESVGKGAAAAEETGVLVAEETGVFRFAGGDSVDVPAASPPLPLLVATVGKKDLTAHRRGQLTDAQFRECILFQEYDPHALHLKTIEIMAGILDKALGAGQPRGFRTTDGATGIYQEGLGALFFVELEPSEIHFDVFALRRQRDAQEASPDFIERLENQLVETVADYGATLRPLKADEYLTVEVRFPRTPTVMFVVDGSPEEPLPSRLLLRARRSDIDAYHQGEIDLVQFRKKVEIQEL